MISVIICGVASYLLIANILQFFYVRQYESFDFNSSQMNRVRTNYQLLEKNIAAIDALDTSVFSDQDLISIQTNLDESFDVITKNKLLSYQGVQKLYLKDLLDLDLQNSSNILSLLNILQVLEKYDSSLGELTSLFKDDFVANAYLNEYSFQNAFSGYQYHTPSTFEQNILEPANYKILSRVYDLNMKISKLNYLTKVIMEVGEANV